MHIYVHVPFCARKCSYCDFAIAVRRITPDDAFLRAIQQEWLQWQDTSAVREAGPAATLYFGGGTPSRLQGDTLAALIAMVSDGVGLAPGAEITIEVNPDDVTPTNAAAWKRAGINRLSLGVQSHHRAVLEWMHRSHRAEQVAPAMATLRDAGFDNISIDLIFALPDVLQRDWSHDLDATLALEPTHLSLYGLTVESHTPLGRWTARGESIPTDDERYADQFLLAHHVLTAAEFEHYEVSNYGLPGRHSRHNSGYWSGANYVGLGPSAHSLVDGIRSWNVREWAEYTALAEGGRTVRAGSEQVEGGGRRIEELYLGLRTSAGLEGDRLPASAREEWIRAGWATMKAERVTLTPEGWLRLDALVAAVAGS